MTDYKELNTALSSLVDGVPHKIANLANASALLWQYLDDVNWAGFYLLEGNRLVLGPFQGKPACIEIPLGKGVCGKAALDKNALVVADVHSFEGHIACDTASNSEIVVPIVRGSELLGVIDIDSPSFSRFDDRDRAGLEEFAKIIAEVF